MLEAYTTVGGTPQLDGQYTVFGKVISGLEVIDKIASAPKDMNDRPVDDIRMTVTVDEMPRRKIEKTYGYKYPEN
jgi:cyclophilin family peptidyl-prolyl cis-trans isomerase